MDTVKSEDDDTNITEAMATTNDDDNNDDGSSSSSDDDEEEKALTARSDALERQLAINKYLYEVHEELVDIYRKLGDLTSLRAAYRRFHDHFPLTPTIWLAWISVEKKLAVSRTDVQKVCELFDLAVEDYLSIDLWLDYIQYALSQIDLETTRAILARALTAGGLHAAQGSLLWDNLRELESAQLSILEADSAAWHEQLTQIIEAFRRQLSVPLVGMESTFKEWEEFVGSLPSETLQIKYRKPIDWAYHNSLKILDTYKSFEDQLLTTATQSELLLSEIYTKYIRVINDPSTILCVYERAVAQLPLNSTIWTDYCGYAVSLGEAAVKISERALRNCPWSEDLWISRLRIIEKFLNNDDNVDALLPCFERGLSSIAPAYGLDLWLTYLECIHRRGKLQENEKDEQQKLYKLFEQAIEQLGFEGDSSFKIARWYARVLAKNGDMIGARRLWKKIVYHPQNKGLASVWLEYANLERRFGNEIHLRTLFDKALTFCTDWPQFIADEWLMFERETGQLDDVLKCVDKCKPFLKTSAQQQQSETTEIVEDESKRHGKKRRPLHDNRGAENMNLKKRRFDNSKDTTDMTSTPKFANLNKPQMIVQKDHTKSVFISNLYPSINEAKLKRIFPNAINIELVLDKFGKSKCFGYVQFGMEEEVLTALARDRELLDGRPIFISNCKPDRTERAKATFKYSQNVEPNKLFVRGLPLVKTQEEIETLFKPYGAKAVRLVMQKSGKSKGLAYVEFEDEDSTKKALESMDQLTVDGHIISVAISAPPSKSSSSKNEGNGEPMAPTRNSKSRLQVPFIPRSLLQVGKSDGGSSNGTEKKLVVGAPKSNQDFRKMLFNKQ